MYQTTIHLDGMMCNMCETHINEAIRKHFPAAKKVKSSHTKNVATFLTDDIPEETALRDAIEKTGYQYLSSETVPFEKKGLFPRR